MRPGLAPVRLRLNQERSVTVGGWRPEASPAQAPAPAPRDPAHTPTPTPTLAPPPPPQGRAAVLALVEAAPAGADEFALTILRLAGEMGWSTGVVALDRQNRLGRRLGCPAHSPAWCWGKGAADLALREGARVVVPGPDSEPEVPEASLTAVLSEVARECHLVVVDLGCRWEPRLFRPVLTQSDRIWLLAPASKSTAMEMRLEQAEFSGWTDLGRVQPVLLTDGCTPGLVSFRNAALLDDLTGQAARDLVQRELRRLLVG